MPDASENMSHAEKIRAGKARMKDNDARIKELNVLIKMFGYESFAYRQIARRESKYYSQHKKFPFVYSTNKSWKIVAFATLEELENYVHNLCAPNA